MDNFCCFVIGFIGFPFDCYFVVLYSIRSRFTEFFFYRPIYRGVVELYQPDTSKRGADGRERERESKGEGKEKQREREREKERNKTDETYKKRQKRKKKRQNNNNKETDEWEGISCGSIYDDGGEEGPHERVRPE